MKHFVSLLFLLFCFTAGFTQEIPNPLLSEDRIIYDKDVHTIKDNKVIPFDKRFAFIIPKTNTTNIKKVFVYQAEYKNGIRDLKIDKADSISNFDFEPEFEIKKDTLILYFLPLKPSIEFDIMIVRSLTGKNLQKAHELHAAILVLAGDSTRAKGVYKQLADGAEYLPMRITYFHYSFEEYVDFFNTKLKQLYTEIQANTGFQTAVFPDIAEVNSLQANFIRHGFKFLDNDRIVRIINDGSEPKIYKGQLPINYNHSTQEAGLLAIERRIQNFESSIAFFDSLYRYTNNLLAISNDSTIHAISTKIDKILDALKNNRNILLVKFNEINAIIISDEKINEVELLIGHTVAKDLKTKGSYIFTLDAGLSNIMVNDVEDKVKYIPKAYWGLSIYFRPIDKNTRSETLPRRYEKGINSVADYNVAAVKSVWQHLSLTVGLTFGSMTNKEFDNFYNNATLMVGPGYRFWRAFKVGAGAAFLKRSSEDPLVTEKKVVVGYYISTSVDIDLIQTVKEFTSILFK